MERLCQQDLGCTPREWFQRERMVTAARLLAAGHSVKTVALELNYTRPANFSRDFKRHHGRIARTFIPLLSFGPPTNSPDTHSARGSKS